MYSKDKYLLKRKLIKQQNNKCCYCWCKFWKDTWNIATLEHIQPKCYVWDNTKFAVSCKKCNLYKWPLDEDLFLAWYINVNYKYKYDWQSENKPVKVRWPLRWYHKKFPNIFNWNKKRYNITLKLYN